MSTANHIEYWVPLLKLRKASHKQGAATLLFPHLGAQLLVIQVRLSIIIGASSMLSQGPERLSVTWHLNEAEDDIREPVACFPPLQPKRYLPDSHTPTHPFSTFRGHGKQASLTS